ncbi:MAG: propionate--CoA ligase [Pseudomonadota bacterium]
MASNSKYNGEAVRVEKAKAFVKSSLDDPEGFWAEQAKLIDWQDPPKQIFDGSHPPFSRWYTGGTTNLSYNAVDRHARKTPDAPALIYVSSETGADTTYSFSQLQDEVERTAALLKSLDVGKGDTVLIYLPMIPEAAFAMLACTRIGAIHSVVFGGFASRALADRIEDLEPSVLIAADAGMRGGKVINYQTLLKGALGVSRHTPDHVVMVDRGLASDDSIDGAIDFHSARDALEDAAADVEWMESNEPSYVLYTSGTTGKPKGVQRDTGGYAVALAASIRYIYDGRPGETFFATSDIGWVVGHSYIVYGPLLAGMASIFYEGTPVHPDPGIWWSLVEKYKPSVMFSAPTAMRLLATKDHDFIDRNDISSLRRMWLAGEPLDEPTARWSTQALGRPVYDHFWQTETGWPIISALPGVEDHELKWGSPSFPVYGYDVALIHEETGRLVGANEKGLLTVKWPLPPGTMTTLWRDDDRFKSTYFAEFDDGLYYQTFDFAVQDEDGYITLLGRSDDVINVAGHRLGTREIESAICGHDAIAEAAVVGVEDKVKGQTPVAFAVPADANAATHGLEAQIKTLVDKQLGAIARPSRIVLVPSLPKTRSGKILRRALQALCEGRDPGDLPTIEDASVIDQIRGALA